MSNHTTTPTLAACIPTQFHVVRKFVEQLKHHHHRISGGKITVETCPACHHDDGRSDFMFCDDGFYYHCFHSGCEYNYSTRWSKDGIVGRRLTELFRLLGGDPKTLAPVNRFRDSYIESIEMSKNPTTFEITGAAEDHSA